jgi:lipopolysaccharide export system permease LptF/LptG-like protein
MRPPGSRLRAIASRLCSSATMERLIDPILADLQIEYRAARSAGRLWRSRWIRVAGYASFLKAICVFGLQRLLEPLRDWPGEDRRALNRAMRFSAAAMLAVISLLMLPVLFASRARTDLLVFSIPQTLPIAFPVGVTLGIFCGMWGHLISARLTRAILALALGISCASLASTAWLIPAAGDAYVRQIRVTTGIQATFTKGPIELTQGELRQRIDVLTRSGDAKLARQFERAYHMKWALPFATFALALFAVSVMRRRPVARSILFAGAIAAGLVYYSLLFAGEMLAQQGALPVIVAMWLPNTVFMLASATLLTKADRT